MWVDSVSLQVSLRFGKGGRKHGGAVLEHFCDCANCKILKFVNGNWWIRRLKELQSQRLTLA